VNYLVEIGSFFLSLLFSPLSPELPCGRLQWLEPSRVMLRAARVSPVSWGFRPGEAAVGKTEPEAAGSSSR